MAARKWYRAIKGNGLPTGNPAADSWSNLYVYNNIATGLWYEWTGSAWNPSEMFKPSITPTSTVRGFVYPETFGAEYNKTLAQIGLDSQSEVDAKFPGMGATPQWQSDRASLQWCMNIGKGSAIVLSRNYTLDSGLDYKQNPQFILYGNNNIFTPTNSNPFSFIYRSDVITSHAEGEALAGKSGFNIHNLQVSPNSNQIAFDIKCSSKSVLDTCVVGGGAVAFKHAFCLEAMVINCKAEGSVKGFLSDILLGNNEMSSNGIMYIQNNAHNCSEIAFWNEYAYSPRYMNCQSEGGVDYTIDFGGNFDGKTTANDGGVYSGCHIEHAQKSDGSGWSKAAIARTKFTLRGQSIKFDGLEIHGLGESLLCDTTSRDGANYNAGGNITFTGIRSCIGKAGKLIRTRGTCINFVGCQALLNLNDLSPIFDTTNNGQIPPKATDIYGIGAQNQCGYTWYTNARL